MTFTMVKIIIQRKVIPEFQEQYDLYAMNALQLILRSSGFLSSEALQEYKHPERRYLVINFDNFYNWNQWYKSDTRKKALAEIMQMLEEPEKITILQPQPRC